MSSHKIDYVNHPLNTSPSKAAYSFGRSQRFNKPQSTQYQEKNNVEFILKSRISKPDIQRGEAIILVLPKINHGIQELTNKSIRPTIMGKEKDREVRIKWEIHRKSNLDQYRNLNRQAEKIKMKCLQAKRFIHKKAHRKIQNQPIDPIGMDFTILQEFKQIKMVDTLSQIITRNVTTAYFGRVDQRDQTKKSESSINLGPGSYDIRNNSPGKYVQSINRNNTAHSFSRSPRKGPQDRTYDSNSGPGMYDAFSQFGPIK